MLFPVCGPSDSLTYTRILGYPDMARTRRGERSTHAPVRGAVLDRDVAVLSEVRDAKARKLRRRAALP